MITETVLQEIVERTVSSVRPDKIVLFGSAARGEMRPDSDIDLLVVKDGISSRREVAKQIYHHLAGAGVPVDVVVVTPEDVEFYRNKVGPAIGPAVREGRVIYGA